MKLNMKTHLVISSVLLGVVPALLVAIVVGWLAIDTGQNAIQAQAENKLIALRSNKKIEIENYFDTLKNQVLSFSNDQMIIDSMRGFKDEFHNIQLTHDIDAMPDLQSSINDYYQTQFSDRYKRNNAGRDIDISRIISSINDEGLIMQYLYMTNNHHALGEKDKLNNANDGSYYSELHEKYHEKIRHFMQQFGYYDIFLVDHETGHIVYSVFKEVDYGTSLLNGPFSESGIGQVFKKANAGQGSEHFALSDFSSYTPSYESPASFIASPIYDQGQKLGVLIFQMPIDRINDIMTYNHNWHDVGLGESGETYLIGSDSKMRSLGRFIIEDKASYLSVLQSSGVSSNVIDSIDKKNTTIGIQSINSPGARAALAGESGFAIYPDYRNVPVLSAYAPLNIQGLNWVIMSEIDEAEAFSAVGLLKQRLLFWAAVCLLVMIVLASIVGRLYAHMIIKPIETAVYSLQGIAKGMEEGNADLTQSLAEDGNPISARLAIAINTMIERIRYTFQTFNQAAEQVSTASEQLSVVTSESRDAITQQRKETEQVATAMNQMTVTVAEVAKSAVSAADMARNADEETEKGQSIVTNNINAIEHLSNRVNDAADVIHKLEDDSENIGAVLVVIQEIAEQTNLLALNAAIEAARAGEQGRGFAVVADEVRQLAGRTQESTQEIHKIIEQLQSRSKQAVTVMEEERKHAMKGAEETKKTGQALENITRMVSEIDAMNAQIAAAAEEQSVVAEEVNRNIVNISQVSEQNTTGIGQISSASSELAQLANSVQCMLQGYKL